MSWPIPQPADIADRMASGYEVEFARLWGLKNPGQPPATVDARSDYSSLAIQARVAAMAVFDNWMFQQRTAQEMMPDTAQDNLSRLGQLWGVPRVAASPTSAPVALSGAAETTVPADYAFTAPGASGTYVTTAAVTLGSDGTGTATVQAATAGAAGTLATGTILTAVVPMDGLSQKATVLAGGVPGQDVESLDSWRSRIIQRIRRRGGGGTAADFEQWVLEVFPGARVKASSPGPGQANVAFAMPDGATWRAPTSGEIATVLAYLNDASVRRPLGCATVVVVGATIVPVDVTMHLVPDTTEIRAGVINALTAFFEALDINGNVVVELLDVAVTETSGETTHTRSEPTSDITVDLVSIATLGTVAFT